MEQTLYSVMLVEDDAEIRERLAAIIFSSDLFQLVYQGEDATGSIAALKRHKPDILLTDLCLSKDESGIDIIQAIDKLNLDTQAMVITGFQDEHLVFSALQAGAKGYLLKHDPEQNILEAINTMLNGGAPISPIIARLMLQKFHRNTPTPKTPETLTERQVKILTYVSQGFSSKEIAEKLSLSYHTVTTHIKNIYAKLQVNSRTEALHEAAKLGILDR
ncbi:LuxR C-terminal-related transcriptional regulator [Reinekea blandensis]|uniref:Probable two component response regulator transcription regulator protein n=1 Tax=Reinekea blandensis MED297 TaxID=314283 RepID=A4BHY4_9GAMM|nr:response regulator transcription factor [Reinekea blandensis]EAR08256.1 probable two component response regulator transcription regulator protein [Reinekea sp. MED297] [Reinekea blandensis MED297]